jgi:thiol-disulfide isomerase/thioredoxin
MKKHATSLALTLLCSTGLFAAELGDPAKPLDIKEWIKGGAIDLAEGKGRIIYVVEFWATWCPPCRTSIPHLTEMQKKFKDKGVVFVGVSDEKPDVVKKFVEKMGNKMDYTVAIDAGKTSPSYMEAFEIKGIPHAFIVDKEGRIAWHGHPMDRLDETLQEVVDGKYDITKAKKRAGAEEKLRAYMALSMSGEDPAKARQLEDELVALEKEVGNIMRGEKFDPAEIRKRVEFGQKFMKYQQLAMRDGDTNEIAALEKELEAGAPKDFDFKRFKENMQQSIERSKEARKIQALTSDYMAAVGKNANADKAAELAKKIEALETDHPEMLNDIAWAILTDEAVTSRDTKLALKLAKRAVDLSGSEEAGILDTYARALFDNGQTAEAIVQQKKAVEQAEDDDLKAELRKELEKYEAAAKTAPKAEAK